MISKNITFLETLAFGFLQLCLLWLVLLQFTRLTVNLFNLTLAFTSSLFLTFRVSQPFWWIMVGLGNIGYFIPPEFKRDMMNHGWVCLQISVLWQLPVNKINIIKIYSHVSNTIVNAEDCMGARYSWNFLFTVIISHLP